MKLVEKIAERIGSFSPMVILILVCFSYLRYLENPGSHPGQIKKEIKAIDKKTWTDAELQPYWLYRD
jgi:hypothetical protein